MLKAVIIATILSVAAGKQADPQKLLKNYEAFLKEHDKDLARLKSPKRLQQYQENLKYIFEHNADPTTTFLLEPNKWTDSFDSELKLSKSAWWKKFFKNDDGDDDDGSYYSDDAAADDADDADDYDDDYDSAPRKATKKSASGKVMRQSKATKLSKATKSAKGNILVGDSYYYANYYDADDADDADDYDDDDYNYATQKLTGDSYYYSDDDYYYGADDDTDDYDDDDYNDAVEGKAVRKADGHTLNWASRNNVLGIRITPDVQHQQLRNTAGAVAAAASVVSNVNQIAKARVLERIAPLRLIRSVKTGKLAESSLGYIARNRGVNTGLKSGWLNSGQMATIQGFERVPMNDEAALMDKLLNGPVVVSICAGSKNFRYYKAGILNGVCEGKDGKVGKYTDHTVLLTGYGTDKNNNDYWLVQNSWGKSWGEKGFARIARSDKKGSPGAFNIASRAVYPVGGMVYTSPFSFWYENFGIFLAFGLLGLGVVAMYGLTQKQLAKKNGEIVSPVGLTMPKTGYETIPAADEESTIIQLNPTRPQIAAYQEL